jgi:hypothetical protein
LSVVSTMIPLVAFSIYEYFLSVLDVFGIFQVGIILQYMICWIYLSVLVSVPMHTITSFFRSLANSSCFDRNSERNMNHTVSVSKLKYFVINLIQLSSSCMYLQLVVSIFSILSVFLSILSVTWYIAFKYLLVFLSICQ